MSKSPAAINESISKTMRGNKSKDTLPEIIFRKRLREEGLGGYRTHWTGVPGKPDIAYPSKKIAIFVNGCFWHRCPRCNLPIPNHNRDFWIEKFTKNVIRDMTVTSQLENLGWKVIVVWECELDQDIKSCVNKVKLAIDSNSKKLSSQR